MTNVHFPRASKKYSHRELQRASDALVAMGWSESPDTDDEDGTVEYRADRADCLAGCSDERYNTMMSMAACIMGE